MRAQESHRLHSLWRLNTRGTRRRWPWTPALHISLRPAGRPGAADLWGALFSSVREHAESLISWARSAEALLLEHDPLAEKTMTGRPGRMRAAGRPRRAAHAPEGAAPRRPRPPPA